MAAHADSSVLFNTLSTKLSNLIYRRCEGDSKLIEKAVDELNSLDYKYPLIANTTRAVLLVNQCCLSVYPDNITLVAKCCKLFANIITKQRITVDGKTCSVAIDWCMQALRNGQTIITVDVLSTLESLLRSNSENVHNLCKDIISANSPVISLAGDRNGNSETILAAVQCLEACVVPSEDVKLKHDYSCCLKVFNGYLVDNRSFDEGQRGKLLVCCLNGLTSVLQGDEEYLKAEVGTVLGIVRSYMLYGVKGVDVIVPQKLMPSVMSIPELSKTIFREKNGGKYTKQRKHRSRKKDASVKDTSTVWDDNLNSSGYRPSTTLFNSGEDQTLNVSQNKLQTSDSDVSDIEGDGKRKLVGLHRKVRLAAHNLFLQVIKVIDQRTVFSYWSNFVSDGSQTAVNTLNNCILRDPSGSCRIAALNNLTHLLGNSKIYLFQAEYSDKSSAFTSFSSTIGFTIVELHRSVCLALNERSIPVLTQVLKCFAALVQATPYHRLKPGLVTKNLRCVKVFLDHKDYSIQAMALIALGCIVASEPTTSETLSACTRNLPRTLPVENSSESSANSAVAFNDDDTEYVDFCSDEETDDRRLAKQPMPWITKTVLKNLGVIIDDSGECIAVQNQLVAPVKLESLQIVCAMARNYFIELIIPHLPYILKGIDLSLTSRYVDVMVHAARALDFLGQGINMYFVNNPAKEHLSVEQGLEFWDSVLGGSLLALVENEHNFIRVGVCEALASVGPVVFECLAKEKQLQIVMTLLALSREDDRTVANGAIRSLGICITFPALCEDTGFVMDTAEVVLRELQDVNNNLRVTVSWSLGNLSETIVTLKSDAETAGDVPRYLFRQLLVAAIKGTEDIDRVRVNCVRAVGHFLSSLSIEDVDDLDVKKLIPDGIDALVKNSCTGFNGKVRWNSCFALGNVLKNQVLYGDGTWQAKVFNALFDLVVSFRNFKVRTNAATALACPPSRGNYGRFYLETWDALLRAIENAQNMEDFVEYKQKDNLVDQICLSIAKLCLLLEPLDLNILAGNRLFYGDLLQSHVQRVYMRLLPEKSYRLLAAEEHLKKMLSDSLTQEQKEIVEILCNVFNSDVIKKH